ncbi:MAG: hypothetical protein Q9M28_08075 [Mariprofundaceae bacterium]|nr:hypothetical protein [Mariprofundaceae bacterium]
MKNLKWLLYSTSLTLITVFLYTFQDTAFASSEILVSDSVAGVDAHHATIATNVGGDSFIVWQESSVGSPDVVKGKVIHTSRMMVSTISPSFKISMLGLSDIVPDVASDGHNRFIVVWSSKDSSGFYQVKARLFNANGDALGSDFVVNDGYLVNGSPTLPPRPNLDARQTFPSKKTFLGANFPDVAMNSLGQFVVVWDQWDGQQQNRYMRKFDRNGSPVSSSTRLNTRTTTLAYSGLPDIDINDQGDVVVAWSVDYAGISAIAYRYWNLAVGMPTGDEMLISLPKVGFHQVRPMVSINAQGDALIVWSEEQRDGPRTAIFARTYSAVSGLWSAVFSPKAYKTQPSRITGLMLSTGETLLGYSPIVSSNKAIVLEKMNNVPISIRSGVVTAIQSGYQRRAALSLLEATKYNWLVTTWEGAAQMGDLQSIYCKVIRLKK